MPKNSEVQPSLAIDLLEAAEKLLKAESKRTTAVDGGEKFCDAIIDLGFITTAFRKSLEESKS